VLAAFATWFCSAVPTCCTTVRGGCRPEGRAGIDARWIVALERSAHVAIEGSIQRACAGGIASWLLANVYLIAQLAITPGALLWLHHRSPRIYSELRNTVLVTWLIAVPVFAVFPVSPPRLAGIGIADTVSQHAPVSLTGGSTLFYNPFAAVASLHVGFALAIGIAAAAALRARWSKALALLWAPLVTLAVLATGNHYLFDVAAGLLTVGVAFCAQRSARLLPPWRSSGAAAPALAVPSGR
jgi:PAP2 superfamily